MREETGKGDREGLAIRTSELKMRFFGVILQQDLCLAGYIRRLSNPADFSGAQTGAAASVSQRMGLQERPCVHYSNQIFICKNRGSSRQHTAAVFGKAFPQSDRYLLLLLVILLLLSSLIFVPSFPFYILHIQDS